MKEFQGKADNPKYVLDSQSQTDQTKLKKPEPEVWIMLGWALLR